MHIRHLKELFCIVDLILTTLKKEDFIDITLKFSGIISREISDDSPMNRYIHVTDAMCKVFAEYNESGIFLSSTATKSIVKWLSMSKQGNFMRVNSYLSFIESLESAEITSIEINGEEKLKEFVNPDNSINLSSIMEYVASRTSNRDIKVNLTADNKYMSMLYTDGIFSRLVKQNETYTLYINSKEAMDRIMSKFYVSGFSLCSGVPSINTRIMLYEQMAEQDNCKFVMKTANS